MVLGVPILKHLGYISLNGFCHQGKQTGSLRNCLPFVKIAKQHDKVTMYIFTSVPVFRVITAPSDGNLSSNLSREKEFEISGKKKQNLLLIVVILNVSLVHVAS